MLLNAKVADDISAVRLHSKSSVGVTAAVCSMYSSLLHHGACVLDTKHYMKEQAT